MVEKVRTAIFGKDQRVEIKKYPLTKAGNKIHINSGGEGYFMPEIGPNQFLDWPIRKKYLFFGPWIYARTFITLRLGTKCIDFSLPDPKAYGPDLEQLKRANEAYLATRIGSDAVPKTPMWVYIMIFLLLGCLGLLIRIAGVFA